MSRRLPRIGGETVSGNVKVTTTGPVKCGGLELTSCWSTHGRGNVEKGEVDQCTVFEGEWEANREYCYPFTLKTAAWPPTYYGTYVNVSHYVCARAKLPWSSDPKTEAEFTVLATTAPEDLKPVVAPKPRSMSRLLIGWTVGLVLLVIFGCPRACRPPRSPSPWPRVGNGPGGERDGGRAVEREAGRLGFGRQLTCTAGRACRRPRR